MNDLIISLQSRDIIFELAASNADEQIAAHEVLHSIGLDYTFLDDNNRSKYNFTKYLTDNIMDYPKYENDKRNQNTIYKWQWDTVADFAEDENIFRGLEKESE